MNLNPPNPHIPHSQIPFQLQVTVLNAHNLPLGRTKFYASVTDGARTWQTRSVRSVGNSVEWNEKIDAFDIRPLSRILISLYAKRAVRKDTLVGRKEFICEPQSELDIVFGSADRHPGRPTEPPATTYLTITVSGNATAIPDNPVAEEADACLAVQVNAEATEVTTTRLDIAEQPIETMQTWTPDNPVAEGADACPAVQVNDEPPEPTEIPLDMAEQPIDTIKTRIPDNPVAEEADAYPVVQVDAEATEATAIPLDIAEQLIDTIQTRIPDNPVAGVADPCPPVQVNDEPTDPTEIPLDMAEQPIDTMKTWRSAIDTVKRVMDAVSQIGELNLYAKSAWSLLSTIPQTLPQQVQRDDNVRTLLEAIRDTFEFSAEAGALGNIKPESMRAKILEDMLLRVYEFGKFIKSYANDVQVGKRFLNIGGQVGGEFEHYSTALIRLRDGFLARAAVITEVTVLRMQDNVNQVNGRLSEMPDQPLAAELDAMIREMPYRGGWQFDIEKRCLPGTRQDFLDYVTNWVENPESERALVLLGPAGTGKSSIAHEVARRFENKRLGSYFAFLRKEQSKDEAYQLFTTLARDLSDRYPAFKLALRKVIKNNPSIRRTRDYRTLFERLLLEPLKNLRLADPILVIIDALDESGDAIGKSGLHIFLSQHLFDLPAKFRVLITSRPDNGIGLAFSNALSVRTLQINDVILAAKKEQDITVYLEKELPPDVFKDHGVKLVTTADGLFQWAAVACGFINNPPVSFGFSENKCVQRLLELPRDRNGQDPLDNLYEEVLEAYFKPQQASILFRSVMGQLLVAIEPLSVRALTTLRQYTPINGPENARPVVELLRHIDSLLSNVNLSDQTCPIIPLHTSFRDFLTDKKSDVFYVDLGDAHYQLAHSCLGLMLDNLKFNICKLESSYLANAVVPDLEARIAEHITPALTYACIHWHDHLQHLAFDHDILEKLRSLFEMKFLFWLEVLSIKSSVGLASRALSSLSIWLRREHSRVEAKNLLALVNDASAFVRYFGTAVARSAPHIYISALPFAPTSSLILKQYLHQFPRTLTLERGQLSHWPALKRTIQAHSGWISSVAFSPDGQRITSASSDCTIRVWDATTGEAVAGPFTGHTSWITSVAFSPNGQRIASASCDYMICVWDAITGEVVVGPFTGHTDSVTSVSFSKDGQRIASASSDCTIRIWDAATGEVIAGPFIGHADSVFSVAFSPDGQLVASASSDCTIRVWDSATGQVVAGPFTGHTSSVFSVSFSPDGQSIASASDDHTIRVWGATTGQIVAGPYTGHTDSIFSVAFSPDGKSIASASDDRTIRVWDARTGQLAAGPFTGHTNWVRSVAFSPDGQHVASASSDRTIRVWDTTTGQVATSPFTGHTNWVRSVAFSSDGQHIVSASSDRTIRVWDATTGEVAAGPFTGHTDWVTSVSFSPDGQRIVSASSDRTIRVWDARTGEVVAGPFTGHTNWVRSVAFSQDGLRIASASSDGTIRVWDAATGQVVAGPFTGTYDSAISVVFSPDGPGRRIASALSDHTIRVWDSTTGQVVAGPFVGHTSLVSFVAFSPNGRCIASASRDNTIRVWDATTGQALTRPFTGHTDSVISVAFSPDGRRIASASADRTIRVWDAATGQVVAGPFAGHTSSVVSVSFSPDGQCIASASSDCTIRMWGAGTRQAVAAPFADDANQVEKIDGGPFMDQSVISSDGWIYGEEKELLLWIPELHRSCLQRPSNVWIAGENETRLDLSKFVHGSKWATVQS